MSGTSRNVTMAEFRQDPVLVGPAQPRQRVLRRARRRSVHRRMQDCTLDYEPPFACAGHATRRGGQDVVSPVLHDRDASIVVVAAVIGFNHGTALSVGEAHLRKHELDAGLSAPLAKGTAKAVRTCANVERATEMSERVVEQHLAAARGEDHIGFTAACTRFGELGTTPRPCSRTARARPTRCSSRCARARRDANACSSSRARSRSSRPSAPRARTGRTHSTSPRNSRARNARSARCEARTRCPTTRASRSTSTR